MEVILSSPEMRECDTRAVEEYNIPSLLLMENAGRSVVDSIEKHFGSVKKKSFLIFCGKGNNGGDGFVVARHLFQRGAFVHILLAGKQSEIKGDAKINLAIALQLQKKTKDSSQFSFAEIKKPLLKNCPNCDIIIDALFGTGFSGEVRKPYSEIIEWMNSCGKPVVAIDIPSGINSDNGTKTNVAVHASLTVTMGAYKTGLLVQAGKEHSGILDAVDISIPKKILEEKRITFLLKQQDISNLLPKRNILSNKYSTGKVFVLAGSKQYPGAPVITATSAMKSGAGAVILGSPKSMFPLLAKKCVEVMLEPLGESNEETLSLAAKEKVFERIAWSDVIAIGPGISRNDETMNLVGDILRTCTKPIVLDADGLHWFTLQNKNFKFPLLNVILTPHSGELSRMTGLTVEEIENNRVEVARSVAKKLNAVLVLKGNPTIISCNGNVYFNTTSNPGMATAGSGDVLTGMIAGILAQMKPFNSIHSFCNAALCGVYLHGLAGDIAKEQFGERSLMATDIIEDIGSAFKLL